MLGRSPRGLSASGSITESGKNTFLTTVVTELIDRLRLAPPARVLSVLTLQGAVAHVDMPVESGPTLYLPHSQKSTHGYLAYWIPSTADSPL